MYAFIREQPASHIKGWAVFCGAAGTAFLLLGARGIERTGMLALAAVFVIAAERVSWGGRITDRLGDLSYGMYIFAFPVQQVVVAFGRSRGWSFEIHLCLSFAVTCALAYASWHGLEKPALKFKPRNGVRS